MKNYMEQNMKDFLEATAKEATQKIDDETRKKLMMEAIRKFKQLIDSGIFKDGVDLTFTADLSKGSVNIREQRGFVATLNPLIIKRIEGEEKGAKKPPPSQRSIKMTKTKKDSWRNEVKRLGVKDQVLDMIDQKFYDALIASKKEPWYPNLSFYKVMTTKRYKTEIEFLTDKLRNALMKAGLDRSKAYDVATDFITDQKGRDRAYEKIEGDEAAKDILDRYAKDSKYDFIEKKKPRFPGNWRQVKLNTINRVKRYKLSKDEIEQAKERLIAKKEAFGGSLKPTSVAEEETLMLEELTNITKVVSIFSEALTESSKVSFNRK